MKGFRLFIVLLILGFQGLAQGGMAVKRPKLVVGMVVDQMRWDYLYRFQSHYGEKGFRRLLKDGFSCENTMINYLPSFTAPGHATIYTGSVPAIHGITGNDWINNSTGKSMYCVADTGVSMAGEDPKKGSMSPANLLTTTITDELRLATNFRSKVYGIALKDRGSILPAGHLANAAYWYNDKTGRFTTSNYYKDQNMAWLQAFNDRNTGDSLLKLNWPLLYPDAEYTESTADDNNYERAYKGAQKPVFPHRFDSLSDKERRSILKGTPAGNTYTILMAEACIKGAQLGMSKETDFLAVSLSSTDYVGHQFGPNSLEVEDMYLRLDRDIAAFLDYLDKTIGAGNYLFFLSADHGAAHNPAFLTDNHIPAGVSGINYAKELNSHLASVLHKDSLVLAFENYQVYLNNAMISKSALDRNKLKEAITEWLDSRPEVATVVDLEASGNTNLPEPIKTMVINGYYKARSGAIQVIMHPGWFSGEGHATGTTHGTWNAYDTHIPLLWYGWHIPTGATNTLVNMTDIAATLAALLHIQMPNGCIGKPVPEFVK